MKIVVNEEYGRFSVSEALYEELGLRWDNHGNLDNETFGINDDNDLAYRANEKLISAIEKIGEDEASGDFATLKIVEIPDGIEWYIDVYDGIETVHEQHRSW